ncbi:ankyrin repeat-containing domain protein, partial [Lactifluus subvellereus]
SLLPLPYRLLAPFELTRAPTSAHRANANASDDNDQTPLHLASKAGHLDVVRLLLEYDANVSALDWDHASPFTWQQFRETRIQFDVAQLLLNNRGANVKSRDKAGRTPLHSAAWNGHLDMREFIVGIRRGY